MDFGIPYANTGPFTKPDAAVEFAHNPPISIDFYPLCSGLAAEIDFHLCLKPDLADLKPGNEQKLVGIFNLVEIIVADRPDITHHMRQI